MGKRELLLIGGFILFGIAVYAVTAPAAQPGQAQFSLSKVMEHVRREMRGNRSSAEVKTTTTVELKAGVTEVRFETGAAPLTVIGEDRDDMQCELLAWSNGYDEAEARKYASDTLLKSTDAGASIVIGVAYPEPGTQRATLVIRMPRTLAVRVQPSRGKLDISDVASVEIVEARSAVSVARVKGRVSGTHRGGPLNLESVGTVKLNTRGSVITMKDVKGEIALQVQAGEVRGETLTGPIEIESNGTRIAFDDLSRTRTPIRINAVTGAVALAGIWTDTRIDGRDTRITVKIDRPVPVAIYTEGDDPLEVTLPKGGYQLDALATNADLTVPTGLPDVKSSGEEHRATGPVDGGGPTITLRNTRGTIVLRARETTS